VRLVIDLANGCLDFTRDDRQTERRVRLRSAVAAERKELNVRHEGFVLHAAARLNPVKDLRTHSPSPEVKPHAADAESAPRNSKQLLEAKVRELPGARALELAIQHGFVEQSAPNNGVRFMRAKNHLYTLIRGGKDIGLGSP